MPDRTPGDDVVEALPEGSDFDGVLLASGPARIRGRLRGEVVGTAPVEIGAGAEVEGPVEAPEIRVAGRVTGNLVASERVKLAETAEVEGHIQAPRLSAEDGARVDGRRDDRRAPRRRPGVLNFRVAM